jgi:ElaB/YqjD/DUF883 family membrane-anchored ribosome-binding protein
MASVSNRVHPEGEQASKQDVSQPAHLRPEAHEEQREHHEKRHHMRHREQGDVGREKMVEVVEATEECIRAQPLRSALGAAGMGFLLGLVFGRR